MSFNDYYHNIIMLLKYVEIFPEKYRKNVGNFPEKYEISNFPDNFSASQHYS